MSDDCDNVESLFDATNLLTHDDSPFVSTLKKPSFTIQFEKEATLGEISLLVATLEDEFTVETKLHEGEIELFVEDGEEDE